MHGMCIMIMKYGMCITMTIQIISSESIVVQQAYKGKGTHHSITSPPTRFFLAVLVTNMRL